MENNNLFLFSVLVGSTPRGRLIEQHDMFFGIAEKLEDLTGDIKTFWHRSTINDIADALKEVAPNSISDALRKDLLQKLSNRDQVHIDAWMKVQYAGEYKIRVTTKPQTTGNGLKLYFINLGGYLENDFEEYHKKIFVVAGSPSQAIDKARQHSFMQTHTAGSRGTKGRSHIDDQHTLNFEADDIICVSDSIGKTYTLLIEPADGVSENETAIGYIKLPYLQ